MTAEVDLAPDAEARLRAALDAAATTAPVPPAWDAIHERVATGAVVTLHPPRRRASALVAAAAVVALVLGGIGLATTRDDEGDVTAAGGDAYCAALAQEARARVEVVVYVAPGAADDGAAVRDLIVGSGLAADLRFVDRQAAYAEARALFADQPTVQDLLRPEDVPTSFRLTVADAGAADRLAAALDGEPEVLAVEDARAWRVDVLQVLAELADADEASLPLAAPGRLDAPVLAAVEAALPPDLAGPMAAVGPALRSRTTPAPAERDAAARLVEDAAGRCGRRADPLPEPPPTVALGGDEELPGTTEPG